MQYSILVWDSWWSNIYYYCRKGSKEWIQIYNTTVGRVQKNEYKSIIPLSEGCKWMITKQLHVYQICELHPVKREGSHEDWYQSQCIHAIVSNLSLLLESVHMSISKFQKGNRDV